MMSCCRAYQQIIFVKILFSLRWYVQLVLQSWTLSLCSRSSMEYSEGEPALQGRRQTCAPDSSSLKPGSGATEGVLDYGVLGCPGYVMWARQMGCEDTRQKTFPCVRIVLSFAWTASLASGCVVSFLYKPTLYNPRPLRCLYKLEGFCA